MTIQAVATNGTVIASTPVANPSADGYNFVLQIPLSTTATDSTAAVGDQLNCVLIQETGLALAASPITVGNANAVSSLALEFVNMQSYTNSAGTTVNVPAEYVDTIAAMLEDEGIEDEDYDPFADYDHDGVSNYNEYRAGTDPFNPDDKLEIKAYAGAQNMLNSLSFEYVGGHIYGVETTLSLTNPRWALQKVKKTEKYFNDHGAVGTLIGRLVPGIRHLISIPAGLAKMQFSRFIFYTTIGAGVWNIILAAIGYGLQSVVPEDQLMDKVNEYSHELGIAMVALFLGLILFLIYKERFSKKSQNQETE